MKTKEDQTPFLISSNKTPTPQDDEICATCAWWKDGYKKLPKHFGVCEWPQSHHFGTIIARYHWKCRYYTP